jgi:hypothetical protein
LRSASQRSLQVLLYTIILFAVLLLPFAIRVPDYAGTPANDGLSNTDLSGNPCLVKPGFHAGINLISLFLV